MSTWLTFFQSYLNPGKLAAVTVPGMVIAFALVLALGPIPCQKPADCPYCSSNLKPVKDTTDTAKNTPAANPQLFVQGAENNLGWELGQAANLDLTNEISTFNKDPLPGGATSKEVSPLSPIVDPASAAPVAPNAAPTQPKTTLVDSCLQLPRYIVANSSAVVDVSDAKALTKAQQAAEKAGVTLYVIDATNNWKPTTPISQIESKTVADCNNLLSQIKEGVSLDSKALTQFLTQANQDLGTLSTDLITAENGGQTLVAGSLQGAIRKKRDYIAWAQKKQAQVGNVQSAETTLEGRLTPLVSVTTTAPTPVAPPTPSTVQDVMQAIQDNLIKFLILSLIIGQILDPLQRGAVSFFGPRRDFFIAFNEVYGESGDGEIRYGDRRLWPWALRDGSPNREEDDQIAAGRAYEDDRNIYDKNYAIGAGYITQSDAQQIENDWFTQSQLTSGLVVPMVILSLSLGARAVCCNATASSNWFWPTVVILCSMPLGIIFGGYLTSLLLHLSSPRYSLVAGGLLGWFSTPNADAYVEGKELQVKRRQQEDEELKRATEKAEGKVADKTEHLAKLRAEELAHKRAVEDANQKAEEKARLSARDKKIAIFLWILVVIGIASVLATIQKPDWWPFKVWPLGWATNGPTLASLIWILVPLLFVIPLWVAGLDRLHKYYSELQARIGGNILRLEATTEQKLFDLLSDDKASCALKDKFDQTVSARDRLSRFFKTEGPDCKKVKANSDPPVGGAESSAGGKAAATAAAAAAATAAAIGATTAAATTAAATGATTPAATDTPNAAADSPDDND